MKIHKIEKIYPMKFAFCGYAFNNIGVLSNGDVTVCCVDYDGKTSLGNLHKESLAAILSSKRAQTIRDEFNKIKITHPYCPEMLLEAIHH